MTFENDHYNFIVLCVLLDELSGGLGKKGKLF